MSLVFDSAISTYFNQFAHQSYVFDKTIYWISEVHLFKGGVLVPLLWFGWFIPNNSIQRRKHLIGGMISCFVAMFIARGLAFSLPMRLRPIYNESLSFQLPYGMPTDKLDGWSAFPSDHAVLFFALSTCIFLAAKKPGIFAYLYTSLFICLPRIYLGLHYTTDILAGAVIGIGTVYLGIQLVSKFKVDGTVLEWVNSKPAYFYTFLFFFTAEMANMFGWTRAFAASTVNLVHILFV